MSRPDHFFKYCNPKVAKLVLSNQTVRWNSPLNFDDPFDCYFSLEPKFDLRDSLPKMKRLFFDTICQAEEPQFVAENEFSGSMKRFRQTLRAKSREEVESLLGFVFDVIEPEFQRITNQIRDQWRKNAKDHRILCVCETNDNLLLWSKYTDNHTGVAIQFECLEDLDVPLLAAKQVVYSDEAPGCATEDQWIKSYLGLGPPLTEAGVWEKLVTTKAKAWEQEREWRAIAIRRPYEDNGYEDCAFLPQEISKVFLGCRMKDADKAEVMSLLAGPFSHVNVFEAKQNPLRYKLDFEKIR